MRKRCISKDKDRGLLRNKVPAIPASKQPKADEFVRQTAKVKIGIGLT
jgi:hypothetical protein